MSKEDVIESDKNSQNESNSKNKLKREKNAPPSKVVIRGLPPTMTKDTFVEQVSPLPDHDYLYFVRADLSLGQFAFSRAYINFLNSEDIFIFTEKFDGYIFVDQKGNEYPAVVEFSPFQKIPKRVSRKKDAKCGMIEADPDYLKFLEQRAKAAETESGPPSTQEVLEEIEAKERELRAHHGVLKMSTPLLDFLRHRKEEKIRIREEKKEERKRREADRRKMREEERRRPKDVSSYSRDTGKDKSKVDRAPKQLLTHKEKDSTATDVELTKKLKEALKINASPDKHDKQKREASSRDGAEKDRTSSRDKDKDKAASREKEHHKEKEGSKDRPEKLRDREQRSSNKEKDLQWQEREEKRAKQRAEERARRNAARKAAWSEKKEKQEQKSQSASSHKEAKSQQATGEDKKKQHTADTPKDKQAAAVQPSSQDEVSCEKSVAKVEKSSSEEPMATKEGQSKKEEDTVLDSKKEEENKKSGTTSKPKPERIRNKVGMDLTEKGKNIKNKDRPSMQLYRPGMLKKRPGNATSESATSATSKEGGAKLGAGQESASTSSSSSPTPPASNSDKDKPESKRRSSAPPTKSKPQSADVKSQESERAKSDDDKVKEDIPVKSRTFKRSFS